MPSIRMMAEARSPVERGVGRYNQFNMTTIDDGKSDNIPPNAPDREAGVRIIEDRVLILKCKLNGPEA